jgi:hypothetical protein
MVDTACDVAADEKIGFVRAAMGGAEQQTAPARIARRFNGIGHGWLPYKPGPGQCQPCSTTRLPRFSHP